MFTSQKASPFALIGGMVLSVLLLAASLTATPSLARGRSGQVAYVSQGQGPELSEQVEDLILARAVNSPLLRRMQGFTAPQSSRAPETRFKTLRASAEKGKTSQSWVLTLLTGVIGLMSIRFAWRL